MNLKNQADQALRTILKRLDDVLPIRQKIEKNSLGDVRRFEVDLHWLSEKKMAKLNDACFKKKDATDVLSFPNSIFFQKRGYLGSIVLCLPVLKRQAREFAHRDQDELHTLLVHGILHLLGFDHVKNAAQARKMKKCEQALAQVCFKQNKRGKNKLSLVERGWEWSGNGSTRNKK